MIAEIRSRGDIFLSLEYLKVIIYIIIIIMIIACYINGMYYLRVLFRISRVKCFHSSLVNDAGIWLNTVKD